MRYRFSKMLILTSGFLQNPDDSLALVNTMVVERFLTDFEIDSELFELELVQPDIFVPDGDYQGWQHQATTNLPCCF